MSGIPGNYCMRGCGKELGPYEECSCDGHAPRYCFTPSYNYGRPRMWYVCIRRLDLPPKPGRHDKPFTFVHIGRWPVSPVPEPISHHDPSVDDKPIQLDDRGRVISFHSCEPATPAPALPSMKPCRCCDRTTNEPLDPTDLDNHGQPYKLPRCRLCQCYPEATRIVHGPARNHLFWSR